MSQTLIMSTLSISFGCFLITAYSKIAESTTQYAVGSSVAKANQGLFTMGIIFIVSGIAFAICSSSCGSSVAVSMSPTMYIYFFLLLGIVLTTLSGVVINGITDSGNTGKTWAITTLMMGIVFVIICVAMLADTHKDTISALVSGTVVPPMKTK